MVRRPAWLRWALGRGSKRLEALINVLRRRPASRGSGGRRRSRPADLSRNALCVRFLTVLSESALTSDVHLISPRRMDSQYLFPYHSLRGAPG